MEVVLLTVGFPKHGKGVNSDEDHQQRDAAVPGRVH
jgi:hypothetical protein